MKDVKITENAIARQIVAEILNFGVSQNQILQTIYLLSLELEDREKSISISEIVKSENGQNKKKDGLILDP